jgi:hypothetical protein
MPTWPKKLPTVDYRTGPHSRTFHEALARSASTPLFGGRDFQSSLSAAGMDGAATENNRILEIGAGLGEHLAYETIGGSGLFTLSSFARRWRRVFENGSPG